MAPSPHIALSYSRLSNYEQCPRQFKAKYIDKDYPDDSDNFFFKKGQRKHKQLETYILNKINKLAVGTMRYDSDVEELFPFIDNICTHMPTYAAEQQLAVNKDFEPCDWFDMQNVMYRAIVDFNALADMMMMVVDWKSGKVREYDDKTTGQLHLTAAMMFAHHESANVCNTVYAFVEHRVTGEDGVERNVMIDREFTRDMDLQTPFYDAFNKVNAETEWAPKINEYCKYCLLTKKQCQYSSKP